MSSLKISLFLSNDWFYETQLIKDRKWRRGREGSGKRIQPFIKRKTVVLKVFRKTNKPKIYTKETWFPKNQNNEILGSM